MRITWKTLFLSLIFALVFLLLIRFYPWFAETLQGFFFPIAVIIILMLVALFSYILNKFGGSS